MIAIRTMHQVDRTLSTPAVRDPFERVTFERIKADVTVSADGILNTLSIYRLLRRIELVRSFTQALPCFQIPPRNLLRRDHQFDAPCRITRHLPFPISDDVLPVIGPRRRVSKGDANSEGESDADRCIHTFMKRDGPTRQTPRNRGLDLLIWTQWLDRRHYPGKHRRGDRLGNYPNSAEQKTHR